MILREQLILGLSSVKLLVDKISIPIWVHRVHDNELEVWRKPGKLFLSYSTWSICCLSLFYSVGPPDWSVLKRNGLRGIVRLHYKTVLGFGATSRTVFNLNNFPGAFTESRDPIRQQDRAACAENNFPQSRKWWEGRCQLTRSLQLRSRKSNWDNGRRLKFDRANCETRCQELHENWFSLLE